MFTFSLKLFSSVVVGRLKGERPAGKTESTYEHNGIIYGKQAKVNGWEKKFKGRNM